MIAIDVVIALSFAAVVAVAIVTPHLARIVLYLLGLAILAVLLVLIAVLAFGLIRQRRREVHDRRALSP